MEEFELVERAPTVEEYRRLRDAVGWGEIPEEGLAAGLGSALFSCVVLHDGEAVACGRVIGDGGMYFYVQDVIVIPEYHGKGLGAQVMEAIVGYLGGTAKTGAFVGLMAAQNAEGFYERYGFHRRPDDRPGMFRVW
ncbi:MAG: GNAT family N-acetyltransferase [Actinomycetota bacterium]